MPSNLTRFLFEIFTNNLLAVTGPGDRRCGPGIESSGDAEGVESAKEDAFLTKNGINGGKDFCLPNRCPPSPSNVGITLSEARISR